LIHFLKELSDLSFGATTSTSYFTKQNRSIVVELFTVKNQKEKLQDWNNIKATNWLVLLKESSWI